MITHIDSCRNGAGYCILGYSCEVDKDFTKDDLGGHCKGLSKAFNPRASFVCCRENPKTSEASKVPTTLQHIIDAGYSENQSNIKTRLVNEKHATWNNEHYSLYNNILDIHQIRLKHYFWNSTEKQTSPQSSSISPPLDLISSASMKIEDSALPVATAMKETEDLLSIQDSTKMQHDEDKYDVNMQSNNDMKDSTSESIVAASVDTQANELKGIKLVINP